MLDFLIKFFGSWQMSYGSRFISHEAFVTYIVSTTVISSEDRPLRDGHGLLASEQLAIQISLHKINVISSVNPAH